MTFRLLPNHPLHDIIDGVGCIAIACGLIIIYCSAKGITIRHHGGSADFGHEATSTYALNKDTNLQACRN